MPRRSDPLTELKIRRATPKRDPYYLPDGNCLRLDVSPLGTKTWTVRYRLPGASHSIPATLGRYPDMSLAQARAAAEEAQQRARRGIATAGTRKARRLAVAEQAAQREAEAQSDSAAQQATFRAVADRWLAEKRSTWSDSTYRKASLVIRDYFNPVLGDADARTIETKDVRPVLIKMAASVPSLARKARQYAAQIVEHAINEGLRGDDSALRLQRVLPTVRSGHMPAVTEDEAKLGEIMRAVYGYGGAVARAALILTATTAVRPGMAAGAHWSEINMKTAEWRIPAERMKMREPFTTSIPRQALEALEELQRTFGKENRRTAVIFSTDESGQEVARAALPYSSVIVTMDATDYRDLVQSGHWQLARVRRRKGLPDCVTTQVHRAAQVFPHVPLVRLFRAPVQSEVQYVDGDPFNLRRDNLKPAPLPLRYAVH